MASVWIVARMPSRLSLNNQDENIRRFQNAFELGRVFWSFPPVCEAQWISLIFQVDSAECYSWISGHKWPTTSFRKRVCGPLENGEKKAGVRKKLTAVFCYRAWLYIPANYGHNTACNSSYQPLHTVFNFYLIPSHYCWPTPLFETPRHTLSIVIINFLSLKWVIQPMVMRFSWLKRAYCLCQRRCRCGCSTLLSSRVATNFD